MIAQYNRAQFIKACFAALGGVFCFGLAYLFFRYTPIFVMGSFGYPLSPLAANLVTLAALIALWFSGYRVWSKRGGLQSYHESAFYHDLGSDTAGAFMVDHYAHRVTASAHVLTQLFLAGPLLLLKAWTLFSSQISHSPELEQRLGDCLAVLRSANKWQSLTDYPNMKTEILHLAQMGLIDFSAHKGTPRIKAERTHGA
jgi:hypothetical protein